jgi:hypothetical protein
MNKNQTQRDSILFEDSVVPYGNGIARFQSANLKKIEELISLDFLSPVERQNKSPTTQEFIKIAKEITKKYPKLAKQIYFHGYVLDKSREDYKTTLEGMGIERGAQDITSDLKILLKTHFRDADALQFDNGEFFCWYD